MSSLGEATRTAIGDALIGAVCGAVGGPLPAMWTARMLYKNTTMLINSNDLSLTGLEIGYGSVCETAVRSALRQVGEELLHAERVNDVYVLKGDGIFLKPTSVLRIEQPKMSVYHHDYYDEWIPLEAVVGRCGGLARVDPPCRLSPRRLYRGSARSHFCAAAHD